MNGDIVIVSGARTPLGSFQGSLSTLSAIDLGALAIQATIERSGIEKYDVDEVIMGCVLPAGLGQGPARRASRVANIPDSTGCLTINKLCGSGMKAIMLGYDSIRARSNNIIIAGGLESMSNAPYLLNSARRGYRMGHGMLLDHMFTDGLEDYDTGRLMGTFAQNTADKYGFSRQQMDEFSIVSLERAINATRQGWFKQEIVPCEVAYKKNITVIDHDEQPYKADVNKIPKLKPAFSQNGTITAANSSSISDGACAVMLMTAQDAIKKNLTPLAKITAHTTESRHPEEFTIAPIGAIDSLLKKLNWSMNDVDLFEINEAFAVVTMVAMHEHNIPHEKVNIHGGACALGHPIGATGCRIVLTLIHALKQHGGRRGIACLCIGGGEATAIGIEIIEKIYH